MYAALLLQKNQYMFPLMVFLNPENDALWYNQQGLLNFYGHPEKKRFQNFQNEGMTVKL